MKTKKMTTDEMNIALYQQGGVHFDQITRRGNVWTVRRGFFYSFGQDASFYAEGVKNAFPNATILESGEFNAQFRGGAPIQKSSHWFVKFTLNQ